MLAEGKGGEKRVSYGALVEHRLGAYGEIIVNDSGHGRYFESNRFNRLFSACNSASQALSTASATATGFILSNPAATAKALVIQEICVGISAAIGAVGDVGVFANTNPVAAATVHTTPLTVRSNVLGGGANSVALADSAATLPVAPALVRVLMGIQWVTAGTSAANVTIKDEVAGALIVLPGCTISIQALTAANSVVTSVSWTEVDWPL